MRFRSKPKLIFAFDVNNTLDIVKPEKGKHISFLIPSHEVFPKIQEVGNWAGLTSGMSAWMCLQIANRHKLQVDFVYAKLNLWQLRHSILDFYKGKRFQFFLIGDSEHDRCLVNYMKFQYLEPLTFYEKFKEGTFT